MFDGEEGPKWRSSKRRDDEGKAFGERVNAGLGSWELPQYHPVTRTIHSLSARGWNGDLERDTMGRFMG